MSVARRGIPFLVAAPSGTGKTTVCRAVMERDPGLRFSIISSMSLINPKTAFTGWPVGEDI